jgi:hypothetical protein
MKTTQMLTEFFRKAEIDPSINTTHIALYVSLVWLWETQGAKGPLHLYSYEVMAVAKIASSSTYVRAMADLHQLQYVNYTPCYYWRKPSRIELRTEALENP